MQYGHKTFLKCYRRVHVSGCGGSGGRDPAYLAVGRSTVETEIS